MVKLIKLTLNILLCKGAKSNFFNLLLKIVPSFHQVSHINDKTHIKGKITEQKKQTTLRMGQ